MTRVGVDEIKSGMILAHPVRNNQGVLLLDAGAKITKKNIRIFKSWGVAEVSIKGGAIQTNGSAGSQQLRINAVDEVNLKEKFADVLDDPVMVEIYNAARRQLNKDTRGDDEL